MREVFQSGKTGVELRVTKRNGFSQGSLCGTFENARSKCAERVPHLSLDTGATTTLDVKKRGPMARPISAQAKRSCELIGFCVFSVPVFSDLQT